MEEHLKICYDYKVGSRTIAC